MVKRVPKNFDLGKRLDEIRSRHKAMGVIREKVLEEVAKKPCTMQDLYDVCVKNNPDYKNVEIDKKKAMDELFADTVRGMVIYDKTVRFTADRKHIIPTVREIKIDNKQGNVKTKTKEI